MKPFDKFKLVDLIDYMGNDCAPALWSSMSVEEQWELAQRIADTCCLELTALGEDQQQVAFFQRGRAPFLER